MIVCEGKDTRLSCADPDYYLRIDGVFFGRTDSSVCSSEDLPVTDCISTTSDHLKIARKTCNGRESCDYKATSQIWGDACTDTHKYGMVNYTCHRKCNNI